MQVAPKNRNTSTLQSREKNQRILLLPKGISRTSRPTNFFPRENRLGHQTAAWLDDIIVVTRGTKEQHTQKLESVPSKLENDGYRASKKKSKFYQKKTVWLGHTISQDGIRRNKEKTEAINNTNTPTNTKTLIFFFGAIQYFAKLILNLSNTTDNMRQLLKKGTK